MSFQTFATQRLAALTSLLNAIDTNAKKIDELPEQTVLNTSSKIHVSKDGISQSLEIQKIIDALNTASYKELISVGNIEIVGQVITLTDIVWRINETFFTAGLTDTIPLSTSGNSREDIFVGLSNGLIERIAGVESNTVIFTPTTPPDAVFITKTLVTDSNVGVPIDPNFGTDFLEKAYSSTQTHFGDTEINTLGLSAKRGGVIITGTVPKLGGFQRNSNNYVLGSPFFVHNRTSGLLELVNRNPASNLQMIFPDEENLFLRKDHVAFFVEVVIDGVNYKKFVASSSYILKASQTQRGGVKTTTNDADPLVYTYQVVDALLEYSETILQGQIDKKLTIYDNINSNTTAPLNSHLNVIGNCTITSPTPVAGKGFYQVQVVNGNAIIDGIAYSAGNLVMKTWHVASWKTTVLYKENARPVENVVFEISYSDLGLPENSDITNQIMADYIADLDIDILPYTNYYFNVKPDEAVGELFNVVMSPITNLMHNDSERSSFFPVRLTINGGVYVLNDNALFTDDEPGIRAFYNAYVALLNTVDGLVATIDSTQDFNIGMESNLLIKLSIDSSVFEGDFGIIYADSNDYSNGYYATRGFTYNNQFATFYSKFYQDSTSEDINSMKFFIVSTLQPFSEYNVSIDLTLLKDE